MTVRAGGCKHSVSKTMSDTAETPVNPPKTDSANLTRLPGRRKSTAAGKGAWKAAFIQSLGQIPNVTVACEAARVSRTAAYFARETSQRFANQWDRAVTAGIERLEARCWVRASVGLKRGVWMKDENGKPVRVEEVAEVSDGLAALLLKAHKPEKYRETVNQVLTNPDGTALAPISVSIVGGSVPETKSNAKGEIKVEVSK